MASIRKRGKYFGAQSRIPKDEGTSRLVSVCANASEVNDPRHFSRNVEQMARKATVVDKGHGMECREIRRQAIVSESSHWN